MVLDVWGIRVGNAVCATILIYCLPPPTMAVFWLPFFG